MRASIVTGAVVGVVLLVSAAPATATSDYYRLALKRCEALRARIALSKKTGKIVVPVRPVEVGGTVEWDAMFLHPRLCLAGVQVHNIRKGKALLMVLPKIIRRRAKQLRRCAAGLKKRAPVGVGWVTLKLNRRGKVKEHLATGARALRWQARCVGQALSGPSGVRGFRPWSREGAVKLALVALD